MPKLVPIKPKKLIKILQGLGFSEKDAEGSHIFLKHDDGRTTVVPIHNRELSKGLLRKILNDIQLSVEDYDKLRQKQKTQNKAKQHKNFSSSHIKIKPQRGFTLIELLVVISILAMLAIYGSSTIGDTSKKLSYINTVNEITAMIKDTRTKALTGETVPDYTDFDADKVVYPTSGVCSDTEIDCPTDTGKCQCDLSEKVLAAGIGVFIDNQLERGFLPFLDLHNNSKAEFILSKSKDALFDPAAYLDKADLVTQNKIISFEDEKYSDFGIQVSDYNNDEKTFIYTSPYGDMIFKNIKGNNFYIHVYRKEDCVNGKLQKFDGKIIVINKVSGIPEVYNYNDLDKKMLDSKFSQSC